MYFYLNHMYHTNVIISKYFLGPYSYHHIYPQAQLSGSVFSLANRQSYKLWSLDIIDQDSSFQCVVSYCLKRINCQDNIMHHISGRLFSETRKERNLQLTDRCQVSSFVISFFLQSPEFYRVRKILTYIIKKYIIHENTSNFQKHKTLNLSGVSQGKNKSFWTQKEYFGGNDL